MFIPCLSRMTSEILHGSLLTVRFRTRLLYAVYMCTCNANHAGAAYLQNRSQNLKTNE